MKCRTTKTKIGKRGKRIAAERTCTAGGKTFVLHTGRKARRSAAPIKPYRFTKADARSCRTKNASKRGACMAERVEARVGDRLSARYG